MYRPAPFRKDDPDELYAFIRANPFGLLVTCADNTPFATSIPMELHAVRKGDPLCLFGHLAAPNPQTASLQGKGLAVFSGPHSYVSSSWYNHPNVSTWNYISVQVEGDMTLLGDDEFRAHLYRLQTHFEAGQQNPFLPEHLPEGMFEKYLKGIVGFRMHIKSIQGKWKLSQNRNPEDHAQVIRHLEAKGDYPAKAVAKAMREEGNQ